jgi:hypothetical protein
MSGAASGVASREGWLSGGPTASGWRPGEETTGAASSGRSGEASRRCWDGSGMHAPARAGGRWEGSGDPRADDSGCIWLIANGELGKWLLL